MPVFFISIFAWQAHIEAWDHPDHPICVHAEGATLAAVLHIAWSCKRRLHVCHVARQEEILLIKQAKKNGMNVTCEVAPHHLFITTKDCGTTIDNERCTVKPCLQSEKDQQALWDNLDIIDCFATDHAPHTLDDKYKLGCPGFPGLESALPLLLTAVHDGRLTLDDIVKRYHHNPKRIFGLPDQPDTYVEVDLSKRYQFKPVMSKAGWSPFEGRECVGAVKRVVLRGESVYIADLDEVLAKPGSGNNIRLGKPNAKLLNA